MTAVGGLMLVGLAISSQFRSSASGGKLLPGLLKAPLLVASSLVG
jgi:uncharacterized membrane protein YqgA involved in biofilm formation